MKTPCCIKCGADVIWEECDNCRDGYVGHECGEDSCCCLNPLPNVLCDICGGEDGWYVCSSCGKTLVQFYGEGE